MFCTRPPGGRSFGVTFFHVLPPSRVTCTGPSFAPTQSTPRSSRRFGHRVDRRVHLLARHVARDRVARHDLVLFGSFQVRSGLITCHVTPSSVVRWRTCEA